MFTHRLFSSVINIHRSILLHYFLGEFVNKENRKLKRKLCTAISPIQLSESSSENPPTISSLSPNSVTPKLKHRKLKHRKQSDAGKETFGSSFSSTAKRDASDLFNCSQIMKLGSRGGNTREDSCDNDDPPWTNVDRVRRRAKSASQGKSSSKAYSVSDRSGKCSMRSIVLTSLHSGLVCHKVGHAYSLYYNFTSEHHNCYNIVYMILLYVWLVASFIHIF